MVIKKKNSNIINEIINSGSEITGSVSGAAIGAWIANIDGAIIGAAAGSIVTNIFKSIGTDIKSRFISKREEVRIGAAFQYALSKIEENLKEGKEIDDFYFNKDINNYTRSVAEEALEGILIAAQREYEENKIKYIGNFYGNILFSHKSRPFIANLTKLIESLSYQQLIIIKLFGEVEKFRLIKPEKLSRLEYDPEYILTKFKSPMAVLSTSDDIKLEIRGLTNNMILENSGRKEIDYFNYRLTNLGKELFQLMEINEIPDDHVKYLSYIINLKFEF